MMPILTGVRGYLIVVLTCISLIVVLSIFSCAYWPPVCLPWRMFLWVFCPFFFFFFDWIVCLFIYFDIELHEVFLNFGDKALVSCLVALFANIFSHSISCLFVWFMVSFAVQKLSGLIRSHFEYFCFHFCYSMRCTQKYVAAIYIRVFCLCFSLRVL